MDDYEIQATIDEQLYEDEYAYNYTEEEEKYIADITAPVITPSYDMSEY